MVKQISFKVPGRPVPKGRPRFVNGRTLTPKKTRQHEKVLKQIAALTYGGNAPMTGPVRLEVEAVFAKPKSWTKKKAVETHWHTSTPDADNLAKITDALNGVVWKDDEQVCELVVRKFYSDDGSEYMRFTITELT